MKLCGRRFLLLIALAVLPAAAQADSGFGRFHALVIGNQNYRHLTKLQTPLADAKAVADVLKTQYGFTVDLLLDKSRDEIKLALSELRKTMTDEQDSLLVYYAGHGYLDNVTGTGYWQPVDAEKDNDVYWLPTDEISRLLKAIRVRHVLIVADSCYSGSLLMRDSGARLPAAASRDEWLKRMQAKRSRTALTSGGEEPVADGGGSGHSVFAKALLEVLRENKEILDGDSLFDRIKRPVILNADQTPLYGDIKMTGHEMGDFLLVPKELQESGVQQIESSTKTDLNFLQRDGGDKQLQPTKQEGKTIGQYIDNGDGTIIDTKTGLMWKRCAEGLFGVNCEKGETEIYTWDEAVKRFKNVAYAGYSDWRLPTVAELKTLVQCSNGVQDNDSGRCKDGSKRPTINQQAFPNTEAIFFWSGSPLTDGSDGAWYVSFSYGYSDIFDRGSGSVVRLVRGAP
ncbi:MAG: Lcl domain-containing protein [Candidatus Electronema sp. V4]|uniref:Lcl domain-containing protein n=1 Tax=Candidatus Electronema sp. V4 TaxID=3454756 RepID=UPI0040558631